MTAPDPIAGGYPIRWIAVDGAPTMLAQLHRHQPELDQLDPTHVGDCYCTCIAALLGAKLPNQVPHFTHLALVAEAAAGHPLPWEHERLARHWLRNEMDADLALLDIEAAMDTGAPYLVAVASKTGPWSHVVVAQGDAVVVDPSAWMRDSDPTGGFTLEDCSDGLAEVLARPYEPGPDEVVAARRRWLAELNEDEAEGTG